MLVAALPLFANACQAQQLTPDSASLLFDAGPGDAKPGNAKVEEGTFPLSLTTDYSPDVRFGWVRRPDESFHHAQWSQSRNALTIDGVAGDRIAFRADIAPGKWSLLLWLEAEHSATQRLILSIEGIPRDLGWQRFASSAEPRSSPRKTYRVFRTEVDVETEGFNLELIGKGQPVRLLGFSLIRVPDERKPKHGEFMQKLTAAGGHDSDASLSPLLQQTQTEVQRDPADSFFALWQERLALLAEAERLFAFRGWEWARDETGLGMFDRLYQSVMLIDGLLGTNTEQVRPLVERATFLRGRILYWLHREVAGEAERDGALRDLGVLRAKHPDDQLLAMYAGEKIDLADPCDCLEAADNGPPWSIFQREALCRMRHIVHWWVNSRQADNGEFGGKLGDDVELLRWWAPLVLSGDRTAIEGWQKLANGVWQSDLVHDGYAAKVSDVEHAAEFISDTAPMMVLLSDELHYQQRLARSALHFQNLWTGRTPQGHLHFRSTWFSAAEVDTHEPKNRDVEYNTRAVQPLRYLAWRTRDPKVTDLLHQWSLAWVSAAMRTDKGKPAGLIPPSVRFTDEATNGDEPNWYQANMLWTYFDWEHYAGSLMLDQLLFTHTLTDDDRLLQPMMATLELIRAEESNLRTEPEQVVAGSPTWAAQRLSRNEMFWQVVEQWRFRSGDTRYDDLIKRHGTPYGRYRITGDERHLVEGLQPLLDGVRYNTPLMTCEAIHTDRVYVPRAELLKAMLTGDGVTNNVSPYHAVTWEETDEHFTALVSETGPEQLVIRLYSHAPEDRKIVMRLWQLSPGEYRLRQSESAAVEAKTESVTIDAKGQRVSIVLPGKQEVRITLTRNSEF